MPRKSHGRNTYLEANNASSARRGNDWRDWEIMITLLIKRNLILEVFSFASRCTNASLNVTRKDQAERVERAPSRAKCHFVCNFRLRSQSLSFPRNINASKESHRGHSEKA